MKTQMTKDAAERKTVKELASEDLRYVVGGADIPENPLGPPEDGLSTGREIYVDPGCLYK